MMMTDHSGMTSAGEATSGQQQPSPPTTRILLVDDHPIVRKGLRMILEANLYTDIVEAGSGVDALRMINDYPPDIAILDIGLPKMRGIDLASEIRKRLPETKIIFLTIHNDEEYVQQAMAVGASGYILKDCLDSEMITAIQAVQRGRTYLTPLISNEIIKTYASSYKRGQDHSPFRLLTNREREILTLLGEGHTNKEVADLLFISPRTVEHHRQHLMKKLEVNSIPELIKLAIRKKLIEP